MTTLPSSRTRRLAAVWFADIVGYSRLASENEPAAFRLVELFQCVSREQIEQHGGRLVKFIGDAALAEFSSTEAAVQAALALEQAFAAESESIAIRGQLRIGVHVGDVLSAPDGDLYGDGVNVAARIQAEARPGQVLVSEDVWRQLRPNPGYRFEPLGERELKGITARIGVFGIGHAGPQAEGASSRTAEQARSTAPTQHSATAERKARRRPRQLAVLLGIAALILVGIGLAARHLLTDQQSASSEPRAGGQQGGKLDRSIAVLPFSNMSRDPDNEYFSDGITDEILTNLSKIGDLKVISRTSVMQYKGTEKPLKQIGSELGVAHVLEGSVQSAGDRVRITAQLINAKTDEHLWAERYDRELKDIFAVQTEIAEQIAGALRVALSPQERTRLAAGQTSNVTAYDLYLKGQEYLQRPGRQSRDTDAAIALFKRALELDPKYALAYAGLGSAYVARRFETGNLTWRDSAVAMAKRAIKLDPVLPDGYAVLGDVYRTAGMPSKAMPEYRRALALNPNFASAATGLAWVSQFSGQLDEALRWAKHAAAVEPTRGVRHWAVGDIYRDLGDLRQAEWWYRRAMGVEPDNPAARERLIFLNVYSGDIARAEAEVRALLSEYPERETTWRAAIEFELLRGNPAAAKPYAERIAQAGLIQRPVELALVYATTGDGKKAAEFLARAERDAQRQLADAADDMYPRYDLAQVFAMRGDKDGALHWLEQAHRRGWLNYQWAQRDPALENLRRDPRFQQMMAELKADVDRMRARVEREGW